MFFLADNRFRAEELVELFVLHNCELLAQNVYIPRGSLSPYESCPPYPSGTSFSLRVVPTVPLGDSFLPTSRAHHTPRGLLSPYESCPPYPSGTPFSLRVVPTLPLGDYFLPTRCARAAKRLAVHTKGWQRIQCYVSALSNPSLWLVMDGQWWSLRAPLESAPPTKPLATGWDHSSRHERSHAFINR